ncbi:Imm21 family immunity protein [Streptomyces sp. AC602_WCS936]|uniref:Imm21 family immunity protein n=1 Tax=Streptomyces sp. AC602_WCS936 TaxID=2823685 RepID=UPI001C26DD9B
MWTGADGGDTAGVPEALDTAGWEPEVSWPVLLFDAARPGTACDRADHVRVALDPGRYAVRAAEVRPGREPWLNVVRLRRLSDG